MLNRRLWDCPALFRHKLFLDIKEHLLHYSKRVHHIGTNKYLNIEFTKTTTKTEILKELADTKKRDYSIFNEEMVHGFASSDAAIVDGKNRPVGAIAFIDDAESIMGPEMKNYTNALCQKEQ